MTKVLVMDAEAIRKYMNEDNLGNIELCSQYEEDNARWAAVYAHVICLDGTKRHVQTPAIRKVTSSLVAVILQMWRMTLRQMNLQ